MSYHSEPITRHFTEKYIELITPKEHRPQFHEDWERYSSAEATTEERTQYFQILHPSVSVIASAGYFLSIAALLGSMYLLDGFSWLLIIFFLPVPLGLVLSTVVNAKIKKSKTDTTYILRFSSSEFWLCFILGLTIAAGITYLTSFLWA